MNLKGIFMEFNTAGLISLEEALEKMRAYVPSKTAKDTESLPLAAAAGRITATPVKSPVFVPPFDNSAMDGYAVRCAARCRRGDHAGTGRRVRSGRAVYRRSA
jgi:molybdopterin molybdotransferase